MTLFRVAKCEVCTNEVRTLDYVNGTMPDSWFTLYKGHLPQYEGRHFCSALHLAQWAIGQIAATPDLKTEEAEQIARLFADKLALKLMGSGVPTAELSQPQSRMRRFVLVDGETAEETEGTLYSSGHVGIDDLNTHGSWEAFKQAHEGSGVTWIDEEVPEQRQIALVRVGRKVGNGD